MLKGQIGKICFSRLSEDEDLAEAIKQRVKESGVRVGIFILIGSLKKATLGYYKEGKYKHIRLDGPLEIASCIGNIAIEEDGEIIIHAHLVVSNEKGEGFGGHLMKNSPVNATAELMIVECSGVNLIRSFDEKTQLKLLQLE